VPEKATVTCTPEFAFWNSSATASVIGYTVLEPSMEMSPVRAGPEGLAAEPPQAAMNRAAGAATLSFFMVLFMVLSLIYIAGSWSSR